MTDERHGIHFIAVYQDIHFHYIGNSVFLEAIIHRSIAPAYRFQLIIKIKNDFDQRNFIMDRQAFFINILNVFLNAAPFLDQLHDVSHIVGRNYYFHIHNWFFDVFNMSRIRHIDRIVDHLCRSICQINIKTHTWCRCNDRHIVFAIQPFFDDFQMQHSKKTTTESKTKRQ